MLCLCPHCDLIPDEPLLRWKRWQEDDAPDASLTFFRGIEFGEEELVRMDGDSVGEGSSIFGPDNDELDTDIEEAAVNASLSSCPSDFQPLLTQMAWVERWCDEGMKQLDVLEAHTDSNIQGHWIYEMPRMQTICDSNLHGRLHGGALQFQRIAGIG